MLRFLVPFLAALALVGAGCGGDDDDGGGGGDWQAEVNRICTANQEEIERLAMEVSESGVSDPQEAAATLIERSVESQEELLGELRDVEVPGDVEEDYNAFLDRIDDTLPLFEDLSQALREGEEDPELTSELQAIADETRPFATDNNLDACLADGGATEEAPAPEGG